MSCDGHAKVKAARTLAEASNLMPDSPVSKPAIMMITVFRKESKQHRRDRVAEEEDQRPMTLR
jgi:hypothetical protein